MKLSRVQIERMVRKVITELRVQGVASYKVTEDKILACGVEAIEKELGKERDLDREVHKMLDDLERQNPGGFERHKMFILLKNRLAKDRKVVL